MLIKLILIALLSVEIANSQFFPGLDGFGGNDENSFTPAVIQDNFIKSLDYFAVQLFQIATSLIDDNLMISPLSVQLALTLTLFGARNSTRDSMFYGMSFGNITNEDLVNNFKGWMQNVQQDPSILTAFKVYITDQYKLSPSYESDITDAFNSEVESIDFTRSTEAADNINMWIAGKTNNRITDLISESSIRNDTKVVLINTIHFMDDWLKKFDEANTAKAKFYIDQNNFVWTDFMNMTSFVESAYYPELDATVARLHYATSSMKMMILLPKRRNGLKKLKNKLHVVDWFKYANNYRFRRQLTIVQLPKFSFESDFEFKETLKRMGMADIFSSETADFTNMIVQTNETCNLFIDKVLHKTFISVHENGTEAAAATAVMMMGSGWMQPSEPLNFLVDHPFIFMLMNEQTIFFMGQVTNF